MALDEVQRRLDEEFRVHYGFLVAALMRRFGDLELAEDVLQQAFVRALETWARDGVPRSPRAWLLAAARNLALDQLRRSVRWSSKREELERDAVTAEEPREHAEASDSLRVVEDDRLRLILLCCHPALPVEGQVALTLRILCGLESDEIARAFLTSRTTLQQRLVRAKTKIRKAKIPFRLPEEAELEERLGSVRRTIYLVFNEGYAATTGKSLVRLDLCREAIRLARLLVALDASPESKALLALLLLTDCRRPARFDAADQMVLLADQDRALWDQKTRREGLAVVEEALRAPGPSRSFALQAAIAAVHTRAESADETDWTEIVALYDLLLLEEPSPVVELNRAVAVAEARGAEDALPLLEALDDGKRLEGYHLLPATRADLFRRLGRIEAAREQYARAIAWATNEQEVRFLEERRAELGARLRH